MLFGLKPTIIRFFLAAKLHVLSFCVDRNEKAIVRTDSNTVLLDVSWNNHRSCNKMLGLRF